MPNWIETDIGAIVNLDMMTHLYVKTDCIREYENGESREGPGVVGKDGSNTFLIAMLDTVEEAQALINKILLKMEERN